MYSTEALDWLCLHVPEGDLPQQYRPQLPELQSAQHTPVRHTEKSHLPSFILSHPYRSPYSPILFTQETLARTYKAHRLAAYGFSESQALELLPTMADDEYAVMERFIIDLLADDASVTAAFDPST